VLIRPEVVEVAPAEDGAAPEATLVGEVVSQTFLGSVTRVKVEAAECEISADVSTVRAESLPVGRTVSASFPPESARLLSPDSEPASPEVDPDDR
jgi:ABC-type Fe3+/spermidine/putrescine transport system ATPase subunit